MVSNRKYYTSVSSLTRRTLPPQWHGFEFVSEQLVIRLRLGQNEVNFPLGSDGLWFSFNALWISLNVLWFK